MGCEEGNGEGRALGTAVGWIVGEGDGCGEGKGDGGENDKGLDQRAELHHENEEEAQGAEAKKQNYVVEATLELLELAAKDEAVARLGRSDFALKITA